MLGFVENTILIKSSHNTVIGSKEVLSKTGSGQIILSYYHHGLLRLALFKTLQTVNDHMIKT